MEILVFFMIASFCSFGILMVMELFDEAILAGSVSLLLGLLITLAVDLIDKSNSREGNVEQSTNVVLTPNSPLIQDVEFTMSDPMAVVAQVARTEQGEFNYVLQANAGMPPYGYELDVSPAEVSVLPVSVPTAPSEVPATDKNESASTFYGVEMQWVLITVLLLLAFAVIALAFWVFSLRTNLQLLTIHSVRRAQHFEALVNRLEINISTLEANLALSQMYSEPATDVRVEKSNLSVHDAASSALKMHRKLKLD